TDRLGEFGRAGRRLAQPKGDGGGQVAGVVDPHGADLDLVHPPRVSAQQEDVAGGGLDREVLVHRADGDAVRVEDDPVVTGLGNGTAAGQGGQAGATAGAQAAIHRVVVEVGAATTSPGLDAPAHHLDHVVEVLPRQVGVGRGVAHQLPECLDLPLLDRCHLGHYLLSQHVERGDGGLEQVE